MNPQVDGPVCGRCGNSVGRKSRMCPVCGARKVVKYSQDADGWVAAKFVLYFSLISIFCYAIYYVVFSAMSGAYYLIFSTLIAIKWLDWIVKAWKSASGPQPEVVWVSGESHDI